MSLLLLYQNSGSLNKDIINEFSLSSTSTGPTSELLMCISVHDSSFTRDVLIWIKRRRHTYTYRVYFLNICISSRLRNIFSDLTPKGDCPRRVRYPIVYVREAIYRFVDEAKAKIYQKYEVSIYILQITFICLHQR